MHHIPGPTTVTDMIEFYESGANRPLAFVESSFQPIKGCRIVIEDNVYRVVGSNFNIDYPGTRNKRLRLVVELEWEGGHDMIT